MRNKVDMAIVILLVFLSGSLVVNAEINPIFTAVTPPAKVSERKVATSDISGNNKPTKSEGEEILPEGISEDLWVQIQEDIWQREYHVTWQDQTVLPDLASAWQSPNRKQNFRIYYTPKGVRVIPRTEESPSWEWGLRLERYGMRDYLYPVEEAKITASGNRISYQRGQMTEWYINTPNGLEQGFTLKNRLAHDVENESENMELIVEMSVTGDVTPHLSEKGDRVVFETPEGKRIIDYSKLHVFDAEGTVLPAYFALAKQKLSIVVDTGRAIYPVTIDPLTSAPDWTAGSGQAGANFGISVSSAGDVNGDSYADVIVGAPGYDNGVAAIVAFGRVFVYHGSATGLSTTSDWTAAESTDTSGGTFGKSVSGAGDVNGDGYDDVIVGAPSFSSFGQANNEGWAYVYHGSATGLNTTPDWMTIVMVK